MSDEKRIKKMNVNFSIELLPKKEFSDEKKAKAELTEEGIFAIDEVLVGEEDFVVVMGRTHVSYK
jgi:hypothetical protein